MIKAVNGKITGVGLTKSKLILLDDQKLSIIETKRSWYHQACWDLYSPNISHIVCNPNSESVHLVKNNR